MQSVQHAQWLHRVRYSERRRGQIWWSKKKKINSKETPESLIRYSSSAFSCCSRLLPLPLTQTRAGCEDVNSSSISLQAVVLIDFMLSSQSCDSPLSSLITFLPLLSFMALIFTPHSDTQQPTFGYLLPNHDLHAVQPLRLSGGEQVRRVALVV